MSLPNQPEWACPEWGPDHYWHDCEICMEQYELFIEKSQGGWLDEEPNERSVAPIEEGEPADLEEEILAARVSRVSIGALWWEPTNLG